MPAFQPAAHLEAALAGRYRLEREIGAGAMAIVYLAHDIRHDRRVALKVLRPELAVWLGTDRFLREIRVTANLQHPHILPLFDSGIVSDESGRAGGSPYYVMPYVEGESLRHRLARETQLPVVEVLQLTREIGGALQYAHEQGVIHRDVKPENVLLSGGHALVADFGIARAVRDAGGEPLTGTGLLLGTPAYMSPEQATGEREVDARSDQYGLACVVYELLAGQPPFSGPTSAAVMSRHVLDPLPPLTSVRRDCPPHMAKAIERALAKSPASRFETVTAFISALDAPVPARHDHSIVVIPFVNLSPDPDNAFFADGLTEEVITDLSRIRALRVISRNSSSQLKGTHKDTRTIGRELGVRYVLEGSIRRAGDSLRVTTELVDAESDSQLWAERFTGTTADIFEIQEQIAHRISDALAVQLTGAEEKRLVHRPFRDLKAFEWYIQARQLNSQFTVEAVTEGLALVERALEREGEHPALLGLKGYLLWNRHNLGAEGLGALTVATAYVDRALVADPDLATALVARAMLELRLPEVDSGLLLRLLGRAYNSERTADVCIWLTLYWCQTGHPDRAQTFAEEAELLDPLSPFAGWIRAFQRLLSGRTAEALEYSRQAAARYPDVHPLQFMHGQLCASAGDLGEAADAWRRVTVPDGWGAMAAASLAAFEGDVEGVRRLVRGKMVGDIALVDEQWSFMVAGMMAHVGLSDGAMWWLRHAAERGFVNAPFVREVDQMLAPLRYHPQMPALLSYMERRAAEIAAAVDTP